MKTNTKVLIVSIIIGIAHVIYVQQPCEGEGLGCVASGLGHVFLGVVLIPIIFGILGFFFSKERRWVQAASWLGISFAVILLLNLVAGAWKNIEKNMINQQNNNTTQSVPINVSNRKIPS